MPARSPAARKRATRRARQIDAPESSLDWARVASLRYVTDTEPGIAREARGSGFRYRDARGALIRDAQILERIVGLAIPPAWTAVWISPLPAGHIQATGRDARGRKQYRYHTRWHAVRDENKYGRMLDFGAALPLIRARVNRDLRAALHSRERVLAIVVRLLETTYIRVGNEEYARANGSFGLTTLRNKHVRVRGDTLRFEFVGKSGKSHTISVTDRRLSRLVRGCRELPGQLLFQFRHDDGTLRPVDSADVNAYLREITESEFTAKDFRTWAGTLLAACHLDASAIALLPESLPEEKTSLPAALA
ncbi:MAG TPA: hypothetical protein VE861_09560, partial [Gemmatimonadaceae bacterium]|nr:hypothetical protein [Gemmatimonadaceae bacterium]